MCLWRRDVQSLGEEPVFKKTEEINEGTSKQLKPRTSWVKLWFGASTSCSEENHEQHVFFPGEVLKL